jgi:SRSO17 transposase
VRFGIVLADAGYSASAEFRHSLNARGLRWAVGIPCSQKVYGPDVQLIPPVGRKRQSRPDQDADTAKAVLAERSWRRVSWRHGTKGPLTARFAAARVRIGDGATFANNRHLPGDEAWLVGEWRSSGERKYYLSNLPQRTSRRALVAAIKARWVCEQGHQQLKQELGLGHFEGRSWTGLHRHALMTCIACAYLQHLRLAEPGSTRPGENGPPCSRTATIAKPAGLAPRHHQAAVYASGGDRSMSPLQTALPAVA